MELVNLLKSFSAKVQTTIKKEFSDNGSVTDNYEKAVDSNLPPSFEINVPIFKGAEPEKLSIETIAHVEGNMALLTLISADAECIIEESRDKIINTYQTPMSIIDLKSAANQGVYNYKYRDIDGQTKAYNGQYIQTRMSCLNAGKIDEALFTTELSKKFSTSTFRLGVNEWFYHIDYLNGQPMSGIIYHR